MDEKAKAITTLIVDFAIVFNMAAQAFGWNPLQYDFATVYSAVSAVLTIAALAWTWWKNMNVTDAAKQGQALIDSIKAKNDENKAA